ncbi:hypothetical protein [Shimia sp. SDUM112013]|uniref:hypothetical protein n=1 Tax=Shimia sp. SDUM112013 TaxID=3136160 RepID=UPI0032EE09DA
MQSIGNLAQHLLLRHQNKYLRTDVLSASKELATGLSSDPAQHLEGNFSELASLQLNLRRLETYSLNAGETKLTLNAATAAISSLSDMTGDLANRIASLNDTIYATSAKSISHMALQNFQSAVNALNTNIAGKAVFAGARLDQNPLLSADQMLSDVAEYVAEHADPATFAQTVQDWFMSSGGGFETNGYRGSITSAQPIEVSAEARIDFNLRANDEALRGTLANLATIALLSQDSHSLSSKERQHVISQTLPNLVASQEKLTELEALLGGSIEYLDQAIASNESARAASEMAVTEALSVDQYEAATRLEAITTQLESLYLITAKLNRLSLMDYLS